MRGLVSREAARGAAGGSPCRGLRWGRPVTLGVAIGTALLVGCDDQLKYVPWFETMSQQPAIETFEEAPRTLPAGVVAIEAAPTYGLLEADTALSNPLRATSENVARGRELFRQFCTPCHGVSGQGDGPVVMSEERPRGIPYTPAMDLHSEAARARSDGYVWGMITDGRGLMPAYGRIPSADRWYIVLYARHLQSTGPEAAVAATAPPAPDTSGGSR